MKPALLIAVVFGAVIAGGVGGYLAAQFAAPVQSSAPAPNLAAHDDREDLKPALNTQSDRIAKLSGEVDRMTVRLNAAETKAAEADALATKVAGLTSQLENLRANPGSGGPTAPAVPVDEAKLKEMIKTTMVEQEKEATAQREAERDKRFEEMRANNVKRSLDTLTEKLGLNSEQTPKAKAVLDAFSAKGAEIWRKADEARRNNTEFDMRTEMATANTAATEEMKALLSSAQLTTFNELVGERGLRAVTDQSWGMSPGGPGGTPGNRNNRPGGNRGGND